MKKLIERRVRHLSKVEIWNIRLDVKFSGSIDTRKFQNGNSSGSNTSIPHLPTGDNTDNYTFQSKRGVDCFIVLETIQGQAFYVSEIQAGSLDSVAFNDLKILNHEFNILDKFILKINLAIPMELSPKGSSGGEFVTIMSYLVDLTNNLVQFDSEIDSIDGMNVPIFKINKKYFSLRQLVNKKTTITDNDLNGDVPMKKSFNFTTLLKFNKMIEYGNNLIMEKGTISKQVEKFIIDNHDQLNQQANSEIDTISNYLNQMNDNIESKRKLIQNLKNLIDDNNNIDTIGRKDTNGDNEIDKFPQSNDEYGTIYANYYQIKDKINYVKGRRLNQIIQLFSMIVNNELLNFYQLCKDKDKDKIDDPHQDVKGHKDEKITILLNLLNFEQLIELMVKDDQMEYLNSQIGYYILFINILSQKIFQIKLPYNLRYCGSTSTINDKYPLFIRDLQSSRQLQQFSIAITLININIRQLNQFFCN